jgi:uncharacterized damage-inducible protein DinB
VPAPDEHGRVEAGFHDDERTMLGAFLDHHRATLVWKASGLTPAQLAQPLAPSSLTIGGLVKHLALVEDSWFTTRFAGHAEPEPWASADWDAYPDWEHHSAAGDSPEQLLALYAAACERSRAVYAEAESLDQRSVLPDRTGEPFTLRWMVLHMIEETARHNGHVDLLRESVDGLTGE